MFTGAHQTELWPVDISVLCYLSSVSAAASGLRHGADCATHYPSTQGTRSVNWPTSIQNEIWRQYCWIVLMRLFSSAHFGRTLESTLSVSDGMMTFTHLGYLSKYFCPYLSKYFCQKLCKYFWSKIVQIFLVKNCANIFGQNCANIFGQKLCKYFLSKWCKYF